jgi:hypothetical protein
MLDHRVVADFLDSELGDSIIPRDINKHDLVEAFCQYVEDDYYEWLKDNFKSFFGTGWDKPRRAIEMCVTK